MSYLGAGQRPWGVALSPDGKRAFTANGPPNDVSVIDLVPHKEVARIKVGTGPWGLAVGLISREARARDPETVNHVA